MRKVLDIAREVATILGEGWEATPGVWTEDRDAFLTHPSLPGRIHFLLWEGGPRVRIDGVMPEGWNEHRPAQWMDNTPNDPRITVSRERSAAQFAQEMLRRFLPQWKAYTDWVVARKAEHETYLANRAASAERLADMVPGALLDKETGEIDLSRADGVDHGGRDVQVNADGSVRIERLSLTPEGAVAFFRALGELSE